MSAKDRRIAELRETIPQLTPREALELQTKGAALVDVREADETDQGSVPGALRIVRGFLELRLEDALPAKQGPVLFLCAAGVRSLFAAEAARSLGYEDVRSIEGGFERWKAEGLAVEVPDGLSSEERQRYAPHLAMPEVGEAGQLKLRAGSVLCIGAGGLGSPAALYLAAAGIGRIGLVDDDFVDRSNLQRQILHCDARVGQSKVDSARETILGLNPAVDVVGFSERLTRDNVERIFDGWDVVLDGSDNFPTRYLVNDACCKLGVPNVHGSIYRFEGQVSVFWPSFEKRRGPCYRCLYPEPPPPELAPS